MAVIGCMLKLAVSVHKSLLGKIEIMFASLHLLRMNITFSLNAQYMLASEEHLQLCFKHTVAFSHQQLQQQPHFIGRVS